MSLPSKRAAPSASERATWLACRAALLLAFLAGLYRVRTFDTFFHLAAGRWIREHGSVPRVDPFSFTHRGAAWLDHSWGFQLLIDGVHRLGGFVALSLYQALSACALCAVAVFSTRRSWAAVLSVLPMFAHREVLEARPHMLGFVCLALALVLMRLRGPVTLLMIPLYALWVTVHGSHLLAFACIALALIGSRRRELARWVVVLVVCAGLAVWLSPHALGQGGQHLASAFLEGNVSEWYPVTLADLIGSWPGRTFLLLVALTLVGVALDRSDVRGLLALFALLALACTSRRMVALFVLAAQPLWLPYAARALEAAFSRVPSWSPTASLVALLACSGGLWLPPFELGAGLARARFPEAAVGWLRTHPELARLYNAYNFGGYLMWAQWPPAGVFVDGRAITVYPGAFLEQFERGYDDPRAFEALAGRYRVDSVMLPTQSERVAKLRRYLSQRWQLRYSDPVAAIYSR
jgi:hypothetical protein